MKPVCRRLIGLTALLAVSHAALFAAPPGEKSGTPLPYTGVNLSGAEFGPYKRGTPRRYGYDYGYPSENEINYFASKGMNVFRIPFRWETLQPELKGGLDTNELARLREVTDAITKKGYVAVLDPHNYARYDGKIIGSGEITSADFADFWAKLATVYKGNDRVWLGLMNEPHDMPSAQWLDAANAAIASIRRTGAKNRILVPGNHWTGAHSWAKSDNAQTMLQIKDPANRFLFDVHQYLDNDSSGRKETVVSPTIGEERLTSFVAWCRANKKRAFLGEFGVASSKEAREAVDTMLHAMERNRDVWAGFTWWAAGPRWGEYMFTIEPKNLTDRPQMQTLRPHLQTIDYAPAFKSHTKGQPQP